MNAETKIGDLVDAQEWLSAGGYSENRAVVSRATGAVHWVSEDITVDVELPPDLDDPNLYEEIPNKHDLDLGQRLVRRYVDTHLPDASDLVRQFFAKPGGFGRFKDLLRKRGQLEAWYRYEEEETERALREWAADNGIGIAPD